MINYKNFNQFENVHSFLVKNLIRDLRFFPRVRKISFRIFTRIELISITYPMWKKNPNMFCKSWYRKLSFKPTWNKRKILKRIERNGFLLYALKALWNIWNMKILLTRCFNTRREKEREEVALWQTRIKRVCKLYLLALSSLSGWIE